MKLYLFGIFVGKAICLPGLQTNTHKHPYKPYMPAKHFVDHNPKCPVLCIPCCWSDHQIMIIPYHNIIVNKFDMLMMTMIISVYILFTTSFPACILLHALSSSFFTFSSWALTTQPTLLECVSKYIPLHTHTSNSILAFITLTVHKKGGK